MNKCVIESRDQASIALQTISQNWGVPPAETIKNEITNYTCLCCIAQISAIYQN